MVPKCHRLQLLDECIVYERSNKIIKSDIKMHEKYVIIDVKCAQAIYRGADTFIPGVIALSLNSKAQDLVSIYADLKGKCLKGSDATNYVLKNRESLKFIGNGWVLFDRDNFFKKDLQKSGIGVRIKELSDGSYVASFENLNQFKYFPQNLPSMLCARVLDPRPGHLILDMCAAPGGKTTYIAELIKNKGRIIAFDKIASKIHKMKELCKNFGATSVECHVQDATKIDFNIYQTETFDRILVDSPCSALGQRPSIFNKIKPSQLKSYISYQRMILDNAVKLLKPGGFLVFSTCTITIEENEEQVSWLLQKYKFLKLVDQ
ncbi:methyltransferase NSUN6, partial [Brachionus plicatilis]